LQENENSPRSSAHGLPFAVGLKRGLYEAIFRRRDMREFLSDPIPDEVLARVLIAAHHAASVGFTQPWDFVVIRDLEPRRRVHAIFDEERIKNADQFVDERRANFLSLKLEGILESPLNVLVTCTPGRSGPGILGKTSIRDVEIYSACLAVENFWLAARAEGLGVGWVSILRNEALVEIFSIPSGTIPLAYLCVGYVRNFPDQPVLATQGWARRLPPRTLLHFDSWHGDHSSGDDLITAIQNPDIWHEIFPDEDPGEH
jgi:5,6-dimethylbenzimidazole synthase